MPLFQGFRPVAGTICPSRAAAVVGPSRAPQGMKKGRRPRRRPRLKLSDKAGPDQCPVPGENALFPAQIAGFLAVSRPVPVYPVFLNYVVPVHRVSSPILSGISSIINEAYVNWIALIPYEFILLKIVSTDDGLKSDVQIPVLISFILL